MHSRGSAVQADPFDLRPLYNPLLLSSAAGGPVRATRSSTFVILQKSVHATRRTAITPRSENRFLRNDKRGGKRQSKRIKIADDLGEV